MRTSGSEVCLTSPSNEAKDVSYALGTRFLQLPARASRDGAPGESAVGTAVHVELLSRFVEEAGETTPPYLSVAFEPATGEVLDCRAVPHSQGCKAYEEVLWGFIEAYLQRLDRRKAESAESVEEHKPALLTTTDSALADYIFGLLQGCGMDILCVDAAAQKVQWPSRSLQAASTQTASGNAGEGEPTLAIATVFRNTLTSLVVSGRVQSTLSTGQREEERVAEPASELSPASSLPGGLTQLGACHEESCQRLAPRNRLKRCSGCKVMRYCGAACQKKHWTLGRHKKGCKDIQAINAAWTTASLPDA
ncbi:hypothetical protein CYMTET_50707 [Cymbomonas tetramitiformis]|uniref:phytol kinase n=1 Tax=Cymbomonas tetramitiformis TaxID=36881 RepID=A0AAE0ESJ0_9CHLO|nr:hypothetical protein CYMTET_50707 [Cymbomonas tetramitiformis]